MFAYFDGSLEDFLNHINQNRDNCLVKIRLAPATTLDDIGIVRRSYHHVLDNFAVTHILKKHSNEKEMLRGQILIEEVEEVRKSSHELAGVTYYKRRRRLTGAKS